MNLLHLFLILWLIPSYTTAGEKQELDNNSQVRPFSQPQDTTGIDSQLKNFRQTYSAIVKELYDSASKIKPGDCDYSDLTGGLERKFQQSSSVTEKILIGYELAKNYYIHFKGSNKIAYQQKAEPLFYSFINFKNGELASRYLKLDLKRVHYIVKEWDHFTPQDKESIMFYGLLRGFDNGLPDVLIKIE